MTSFSAIVKLTCRSAVRSHVFQFLLFVLLLGVLLVPNTIKGDGTAYGYMQVSLEYCFTFITVMLMLSGVWLGCQTMTADVEDCRLHLIVVKPVSRYVVWLGKFTGVLAVLAALLLISSAVVYGFILYQSGRQDFPPEERVRMENEVLTGRRAYRPELPDVKAIALKAFNEKKNSQGVLISQVLTGDARAKAIDVIYRQIVAAMAEIPAGKTRYWTYTGLPEKIPEDSSFFMRYRAYSGMVDVQQSQDHGYGAWGAVINYIEKPDPKTLKPGEKLPDPVPRLRYVSRPPEQILTAAMNEFELPADNVIVNGEAVIGFTNLAPSGKPLVIQVADGPTLLLKETGFFANYVRGVFMIFLGVTASVLVAVSLASFLSMPTAIFITISYMAFGFFASFLISSEATYGGLDMPAMDLYGYWLGRMLHSVIIPLQKFGISDAIANGELIELSVIGSAILFQIVLKGVPLALLGAWLYNRRELSLAAIRR